jgi:ferric-dicitrate binding protein FerR (iron transport regulator)
VEINTQHIIDYLENKLSPEEKLRFEQQPGNSPELQKELKDIRFIWEISTELKLHKKADTERNWKEISHRITIHKYKNILWKFSRNAAAILFLPILITTLYLHNTLKGQKEIPVEQIEQTSAPGLVSKVTLPDGSEVWLNSGSTLFYPQRFTDKKRRVSLTGEAYFKVKANEENRFEVLVNDLIVSAYGTEFNVNAYNDEPVIETTLVSGNVNVSSINKDEKNKDISPGQQVLFDKEKKTLEIKNVNLVVKTSWKDGKMVFRRANMTEIARRLAWKFNVDIQLEGEEVLDYEYSATFTTETLSEILSLLEKSAPIKSRIIEPEQSENYTYSKRKVIISTHQYDY